MTRSLVPVVPEAPLDEIVRSLLAFQVHRVFVLEDQTAALAGVITTMDVMRWLATSGPG
jgi:CBS domain-containing protein